MSINSSVRLFPITVMAVGTLLMPADAKCEPALRSKCNVTVETYAAAKRVSVAAGTIFHMCPDEASEVDRQIKIPAQVRLVGEIGDWYEYEFRAGIPVYARKPGAVVGSGPGSGGAGGEAVEQEGESNAPSAISKSPDVAAGRGESIVKVGRCSEFIQVDVYVDDDVDASNDAVMKVIARDAAIQSARSCAPTQQLLVVIYPKSALEPNYQGSGHWSIGSFNLDPRTRTMGEVHNFSNPEGQRRLEAAKYQARNAEFVQFLRKAGVKEYVDLEKIAANPFVYEQRVVLTRARLMRMISRSEALFGWKNTVFVVTNVPATRFVDPREYSLAIQVEGVRKSQTVPEGPPILHVRYVGASDIASLNPDWYRERVAEAHGR